MKEMKGMKIMKIMGAFISFILFIFFISFISCVGAYQLAIEVQEPAPLTLPPDIADILIVNNSAKQTDSQGITLTYNGKAIKDFALDSDSMLWNILHSLSFHIYETHFFNSPSFYKQPVREDNEWMTPIPLSHDFRKNIFERQEFEGIFSIDRSLLKLEGQIKNNGLESNFNTYNYLDFRLDLNLTCSIYSHDRETPLTTFTVTDSLIYKDFTWSDSLFVFKELPENLIEELAYSMGEKLANHITPSWTTKNRTLYAGQSSRMREAFAFTKSGRWDVAESLWLAEFDRKTKNQDKAQIANNIAVINEMQDKLEIALRWAEKAKEYATAGSNEWHLFNDYVTSLQKRMQDNRLLDVQWGKAQ
jgi:hypothetical protein